MDKLDLVLDKKGMTLSLEGKSLRVEGPEIPLQRIPLGMVGQVVIHGNPIVGAGVFRRLAQEGIPTLLLPARGRGEAAVIGPGLSSGVKVRIAQFRTWSDARAHLGGCAWLLEAKFSAMDRLARALGEKEAPFKDAARGLTRAQTPEALRGMEGAAGRQWFDFMGQCLDPKWEFSGRNRRPPRDPVNALLSLGYTLLFSEVRKAVLVRGLDPCLGFLHDPVPGRDSLALDIMEPLRPGVDALVLDLAAGELTPRDFTTSSREGCRLTREGRGIFYPAWEEAKAAWPLVPGDEALPLAGAARKVITGFVRSWPLEEGRKHG